MDLFSNPGFPKIFSQILNGLANAPVVHRGEWQALNVSESAPHATRELTHVSIHYTPPLLPRALGEDTFADLPWAEDHFLERISSHPYNPPPSEEHWPYRVRGNEDFRQGELFSHTYPERFWPKSVGHMGQRLDYERMGIRFPIGDLDDLIHLLQRNPLTRQAYLPIWFPEDLGAAVQNERVPCTLGYHFLVRGDELDCAYFIRSCEVYRHLRNDVYMACRLMQYIAAQLSAIRLGHLHMYITSLHQFVGDERKIAELRERLKV